VRVPRLQLLRVLQPDHGAVRARAPSVTRSASDVLADLAELSAKRAALETELAAALRVAAAPAPAPVEAGPEYLTTAEAAVMIGVSERHLKALRAEGRGPAFLRVGRAVRYPRSAIASQNTVQLPSSASRPVPSSAAKSR
jgi:hypothetical protein